MFELLDGLAGLLDAVAAVAEGLPAALEVLVTLVGWCFEILVRIGQFLDVLDVFCSRERRAAMMGGWRQFFMSIEVVWASFAPRRDTTGATASGRNRSWEKRREGRAQDVE